MTKPTIKILDATTGEEIVREMNDDELAIYESSQQKIAEEEATAAIAATEKAALLAKLGITDDEAKLLLS